MSSRRLGRRQIEWLDRKRTEQEQEVALEAK
jgi:hypothetical protein